MKSGLNLNLSISTSNPVVLFLRVIQSEIEIMCQYMNNITGIKKTHTFFKRSQRILVMPSI